MAPSLLRLAGFLGVGLLLAGSTGCQKKQPGDTQAEGKRLFDSICARCHGSDGRGGVPSAEGQPAPTNFNDAAFHASRSDAQLTQVIKQGKGPMPPFGNLFDEAQTASLVAHVRSFNPKK
jgi:mono/diheme cytochrome c family protein